MTGRKTLGTLVVCHYPAHQLPMLCSVFPSSANTEPNVPDQLSLEQVLFLSMKTPDRTWILTFWLMFYFSCLLFSLSYSLLIYHSTCLASAHFFSPDSCFPQSSSFVGAFLPWTGHKCPMPEMLTLAKLCFKKYQLRGRYQPVTLYYVGLGRGSCCMPSQAPLFPQQQ